MPDTCANFHVGLFLHLRSMLRIVFLKPFFIHDLNLILQLSQGYTLELGGNCVIENVGFHIRDELFSYFLTSWTKLFKGRQDKYGSSHKYYGFTPEVSMEFRLEYKTHKWRPNYVHIVCSPNVMSMDVLFAYVHCVFFNCILMCFITFYVWKPLMELQKRNVGLLSD